MKLWIEEFSQAKNAPSKNAFRKRPKPKFFFLSLDQNEIFQILPYNTTSYSKKNDNDFWQML